MRVRLIISLLLAAAAVTLVAPEARAQTLSEPRQRQGYYVAGGFHAAVAYNRDEGTGLGPWGGYATTIRVGQLITRRLGLGLQLDVGGTSGDGRTSSLMGLGVAGQFEIARNLALHAGIGLGVVSLDDPERKETRGGYG